MTEKKENVYEVRLINGVFSCRGYEKHTDLSSAHFGGKKKKMQTKIKNDYMSASKYCIFFSSLFIAGNEKQKTKQED